MKKSKRYASVVEKVEKINDNLNDYVINEKIIPNQNGFINSNGILQQIDNENCLNNNVALKNLFLSVIIVYKIISLAKYERDQDKKKEKFMPILNYFSLNKIITNNIDIFWTRIKFKSNKHI